MKLRFQMEQGASYQFTKKQSMNPSIINLESLLDLSGKLNGTDDEYFILNSSVLSLMGKLRYLRAAVYKIQDGKLVLFINKGKQPPEVEFNIQNIEELSANTQSIVSLGYDYVLPVKYNNELIGAICLGSRINNLELEFEEQRYAELLSDIAANALQNALSHKRLKSEKIEIEKRNQLLQSLFEVTRDFSNLLSRDQILKMLSYHLMGQLMVSKFAVLIESGKSFEPLINRFDDRISIENISLTDIDYLVSPTVLNEDLQVLRELFPSAELVSPMIVQGKTKGVLIIGKSMSSKPFDEMNKYFISAVSNTAMSAIENDRLFQEELIKKSIESELGFALEIQKNLLPKDIPIIDGYDIAGTSIPSRHVGGDYFDIIQLSENELLVAIADVSGKGMPASLIMANVQAALRVLAPLSLSLNELILKLNQLVYMNTSADKFITFFVGVLNTNSSKFKYINAGHNPPVIYRQSSKKLEFLRDGGLILGCLLDYTDYQEGEIELYNGDTLLMYTDGITESLNERNEEYGEERLYECLYNTNGAKSFQIVESVINDVSKYFENHYQYDDLTLLVLSKNN